MILAGAGPGDPELITLKALRYLQTAEVVLSDRLVSGEILNCYVNPRAEIVYVGKQCRQGNSTPQSSINALMVKYASEGKLVVRLKGGDVSIFSNILDELKALVEAGIAYEIVPGITAALGAAAYSGIPLTARGYSTAVRFVTCYRSDMLTPEYWRELAATDDTLVFYMSAATLDTVVDHLLAHGVGDDKMLAVISQATTPQQQVSTYRLREYKGEADASGYISPTLAIIGKVVALHDTFGWLQNAAAPGTYFENGQTVAKLHKL